MFPSLLIIRKDCFIIHGILLIYICTVQHSTTILFPDCTGYISSVQQPLSTTVTISYYIGQQRYRTLPSSQEVLLLDNTDAEFGRSTDIATNKRPKSQMDLGIDS